MRRKEMLAYVVRSKQRTTRSRRLWHFKAFSIWCVLLIIIAACQSTEMHHLTEPGVSKSHIVIPSGGNFSITCRGYGESSRIVFRYNNTNYTEPNDHIEKIAENVFKLSFHNVTEQNTFIDCVSNEKTVGTTRLIAGHPPHGGDDLHCRIHNFQYGMCYFKYPQNELNTTYQIWEHGLLNATYPCKCVDNNTRFACRIPDKDATRKQHINVTLIGHNALQQDVALTNSLFATAEIVIPPKIEFEEEDAQIFQTTSDSVKAKFVLTTYKLYEGNPLEFEIHVSPAHFNTIVDYDGRQVSHANDTYTLWIKQLPYANWPYTLTLRARASKTMPTNDSSFWGEATAYTFQTLPRAPDRPPLASTHSFVAASGGYRLYWSPLGPHEHNAEQFRYEVQVTNSNDQTLYKNHTNGMTIWLDLPPNAAYSCQIRSVNAQGHSQSWTTIRIPESMRGGFRDFYVTWHGGVYDVNWQPEDSSVDPPSYTVFWCLKGNSAFDCKGSFEFAEIREGGPTSYRIRSEVNNLNVGVAASYAHSSTGIQWVPCIWNARDTLPSTTPIVRSTNETAVTIAWQFHGDVCPNIVKGFVVRYSSASAPLRTDYVNVPGDRQTWSITNLEPYTGYTLAMHMYTHWDQHASAGNTTIASTKESEPSVPRDLRVEAVSSAAASVSWLPPQKTNGIITKYTIWYRREGESEAQSKEVSHMPPHNGDRVWYTVTGLASYSRYTIRVTAHNRRRSSKFSEHLEIRLKPGLPQRPRLTSVEKGHLKSIQLEVPEKPTSRLQLYVIAMVERYHDGQLSHKIAVLNRTVTSCDIRPPPCRDSLQRYAIKVLAVNALQSVSDLDNSTYNNVTDIRGHGGHTRWEFAEDLCQNQRWPLKAQYYNYMQYISEHINDSGSAAVLTDGNRFYLQSDWTVALTEYCSETNYTSVMLVLGVALPIVVVFLASLLGCIWKVRDQMEIRPKFPASLPYSSEPPTKKSSSALSNMLGWPSQITPHQRTNTTKSLAVPVPMPMPIVEQIYHHQQKGADEGHTIVDATGDADERDLDEDNDDERSSESTQSIALQELTNSTHNTYSPMRSLASQMTHTELGMPIDEYRNFSNNSAASMVVGGGYVAAVPDSGVSGYVTQARLMALTHPANSAPMSIAPQHIHNGYVLADAVALLSNSPISSSVHSEEEATEEECSDELPQTVGRPVFTGYVRPDPFLSNRAAADADAETPATDEPATNLTTNRMDDAFREKITNNTSSHNTYNNNNNNNNANNSNAFNTAATNLQNSYVTPTQLYKIDHMMRDSKRGHVE